MLRKSFLVKLSIVSLAMVISLSFIGVQAWAQTIKLAHGMPPIEDENIHRAVSVFKKVVEQKTAGKVKVEIYPSNQLGREREQFEGVKLGTIEMCMIADGPIAGFLPEIMTIGIPYLYSNEAVAWRSLDSSFGKSLFEEMRKKTGVKLLESVKTVSGTSPIGFGLSAIRMI